MNNTQSKIQTHKDHIQKRINQLQSRLRDPISHHNSSNHTSQQQASRYNEDSNTVHDEMPLRRTYVQNSQYVQPNEVVALRERHHNVRDRDRDSHARMSESALKQSRKPKFSDSRRVYGQSQDVVTFKDQIQWKPKGRGNNIQPSIPTLTEPERVQRREKDSTQILYTKGLSQTANLRQKVEIGEKNDLYLMMAEILANQKNLQKQITLLRSQWSREQNGRSQNKHENETPFSKINGHEDKPNQVISFQDPEAIVESIEPAPKPNNYSNLNQRQKIKGKLPQKRGRSSRVVKQTRRNGRQEPTFGADQLSQQAESAHQAINNNRRPATSVKKVENNHQKLENIIKNQRSKNERFVVDEESKGSFWREVETRVIKSEFDYKEGGHGNNKHQHEHLINTNELQRKLREQVLEKVYGQANNCLYK